MTLVHIDRNTCTLMARSHSYTLRMETHSTLIEPNQILINQLDLRLDNREGARISISRFCLLFLKQVPLTILFILCRFYLLLNSVCRRKKKGNFNNHQYLKPEARRISQEVIQLKRNHSSAVNNSVTIYLLVYSSKSYLIVFYNELDIKSFWHLRQNNIGGWEAQLISDSFVFAVHYAPAVPARGF